MNQRERWGATMHFQPVDHVPDREFGYWAETLEAWHGQGLPKCVNSNGRADAYFGFECSKFPTINLDMFPEFEYQVLEEDDRHQIIMDCDGGKKMINKDGASSIPHFIKFPVENRADWNEFKKRLEPSTPGRFFDETEWQAWKEAAKNTDQPLIITAGSIFGRIRDWMGFEGVSYTIMDDPGLIQDMMEHVTNLILTVIDRAVKEVKFDAAAMWEDICFNHGPIIQPRYFEEWAVPRLKRITGFLAEHGCDIVYTDCDGNINELVPLFMEAGVNCMFPLEVRGGTDPVELREKYGHKLHLMGGVDKTQLAGGKEEIRKEIARLKPVVEDGGYIPHVDHRCPPDVSFENYLYYLKAKRDAFGIPEPEPWEVRKELYDWAK